MGRVTSDIMKYIHLVFWLLVCCVLFVFLQTTNAWHYFYIEQSQLLPWTWAYLVERFNEPGGFAGWVAEFLVQFFAYPYAGAAITAGLLTLAGIILQGIVRRINPANHLFILSLLSVLSLLFIQYDFNYKLQGTVAYLMMLLFLWFALRIKGFSRWIDYLVSVFLLWWLAGPVFVLYALSVAVYELFNRSSRSYWILPVGLLALFLGIGSVYFSFFGEYRYIFLPDGYYHPNLEPKAVIYFSWAAFLLTIAIAFLYGKRNVSGKRLVAEGVLQLLVLGGICWWGIPIYNDAKSLKAKEFDYYSRTGQWERILEQSKGPLSNYLYICYANMALAQKGELADKAFSYDQHGTEGLVITWNKSAQISTLLSDIFFTMGAIAASQEMAFEASLSTMGGGNPRNLQRLVQTNLIYGEYAVAEKYISILEKTFVYKAWAREYRQFLYDDSRVEADPLLGAKRKCLLPVSNLALVEGIVGDLLRQAEYNPSDPVAIEYAGLLCLLSKELPAFERILDTYFGTEVLSALPLSFQEAVIILYEKDPQKWKHYQVSESIVRHFDTYRRTIVANKNNANALPNLLRSSYGNTYWFYYMFK